MHHTSNQTVRTRSLRSAARTVWRDNHLIRNAAFLAVTSVITAGLGFGFWAVVARLYPPHDVGIATSLISTTSLIAYLSLFGLNSSLVRFLPMSREPDALITQAVTGVMVVSLLLGSVGVLVLRVLVPSLVDVLATPVAVIIFVACATATALNLLTDAVFVARRRTGFNALTSGITQGVVKLAVPALVVGAGAIGIFGAVGAGALAALVLSLILMRSVLDLRPDVTARRTAVTQQLRYSTGTYLSSVLSLLPMLIVPLIVLEQLGAAPAGFYYVAFQIATLLLALATAVGEALFAEGSHDGTAFVELLRRSGRLLACVLLPASLVAAVLSGVILQVFGTAYREAAQPLLILFCLNAVFVGIHIWASFALKIVGDMTSLVITNVIYSTVVIALVLGLVRHGLGWVGVAWIAGTAAAAGYAAWAVVRHARAQLRPLDRLDVTR